MGWELAYRVPQVLLLVGTLSLPHQTEASPEQGSLLLLLDPSTCLEQGRTLGVPGGTPCQLAARPVHPLFPWPLWKSGRSRIYPLN